ncbi:hypothetical protein SKAU_G00070710 [Synaphobranchus kaupii]|uniref:Uncharacterized protein n=1 Tax=Synaphobranchus kaupii TaxID=118154 RepID=A0A9Q1G7N0_SYNKA|nr:hypothetical protein SKAU_G00070710 [Synaphobranchus kaupii]
MQLQVIGPWKEANPWQCWERRGRSRCRPELYADCQMLDTVPSRNHPGLEVSIQGLTLLGGATQSFHTPFTVSELLF